MRRAPPVAAATRDRVDDERGDADRRVDDAVDERAVGAVLEQPPHEVGEQRLVRADRRVDAAGAIELRLADDLVVDALAHSVQALELVLRVAGQRVDRRDRERVVGRELRIDRVRCREHRLRAGEIGDVGVHLAREDRVAGEAVDLRALDLAVPVRALDEPHHQAPPVLRARARRSSRSSAARASGRPGRRSPGRPSRRATARAASAREEVEREFEAVGLLGVDGEADVVALRELRERDERGASSRDTRSRCARAEARMQRRELHRDARAGDDAAPGRRAADRVDRGFVRGEVAPRVRGRHRRLAQHVVGERVAARLALARVGDRLVDRAAGDELPAQEPHREIDAPADQRLAALAQQRRQRLSRASPRCASRRSCR